MTVIQALIDLQEVDGRIRELESELKDLPRRKALETARLNGVGADLSAAKADREQADQRVKNFEASAQALKDKIQSLKVAQAALKSNREYQQYSTQIDLISHDLETTENNQLAAMDVIPSSDQRLADAQAKYDAEANGVKSLCDEIDELMAQRTADLAEARKERAEKAKLVTDPRFMIIYERLRTKRWPVIVPLTSECVCDGCHMVQPANISQLVDKNEVCANDPSKGEQEIVTCQMCGRLLYRG